jgi:hypothetical protein
MNQPTHSPNDPAPQRRIGDVSIRPLVVAFLVTILIILVAAIIIIKARPTKVIPKATETRPTSQITQPAIPRATPLRLTIPA